MRSDMQELNDLVGCELSTVAFVRDYVEFQFDGPVLRSLAPPVAILDSIRHEFPQAGSRDALCELIGRLVEGATELPDRLSVSFAGDALLEISRNSSKDTLFEVAHFIPMLGGRRDGASMLIWENLRSARTGSDDEGAAGDSGYGED
jgi:hypothetical protein